MGAGQVDAFDPRTRLCIIILQERMLSENHRGFDKKNWSLLSQGAEAKIYGVDFMGKACVVKERIEKKYRLEILDKKLSHRRLIQEARCNVKCRKAGVQTPCIYLVDEIGGRLFMERILGPSIKQFLTDCYDSKEKTYSKKALQVAYEIGKSIAKMHDASIVHGDLTTSNVMLRSSLEMEAQISIVIIDFGLANSQPLPEDKAVDLYVMERAFNSTHIQSEYLVDEVLRAYKAHSRCADNVFQKLAIVRLRGRKRTMVG